MIDCRATVVLVLALLVGLLALGGCTGSSPTSQTGSGPTPEAAQKGVPARTPAAAPGQRVAPAQPSIPGPQEPRAGQGSGEGRPSSSQVVITGQVRDVEASAQVITFVEPVHGITGAALQDGTEITAADGSSGTLQDVKPGVVVQVAGQAGGSGAVLASKIRVLTAPSPIPS